MYRLYLVAETISLQPSLHEQSHIKNNYKEKANLSWAPPIAEFSVNLCI